MKIVNNIKELEEFVGHSFWGGAYDADDNWIICEMEYEYPVLVESLGYTHKGEAFKVRTKEELSELKKFLGL